ncbi:threonine synthase [Candidatus Termititenax persephonae]|uniref:Threonine synthase n=1 Tax=Candidatus Termititenax persephonae TaxID=2218525 RepID=A0A388TG31_9BACT|nr:threonine synthase [Candidatus Termititenax persephonae]
MWTGLLDKYRAYLPVTDKTPNITLHEGNTPLVKLDNFVRQEVGLDLNVYVKFEGLNPTGSFKDRGMFLAISKAAEAGSQAVICASTGNTSASAAAYAARAGLKCFVLIPDGNIALGKLSQAMIHGAKVLAIDGNFDDALAAVKEISQKYPVTLVNSLNPFRIEGQKTGAFEISEQLGRAPDYHFVPVGNAGNITAYWQGYQEWQSAGQIQGLPRLMGFQAAGAAPIVDGQPIKDPRTIATAIKIGNPASWRRAEAARDESHGVIEKVTDAQITAAQIALAAREGIFCEPASAASIAGLLKKAKEGIFQQGDTAVCVLTGHGLKDPDRAIAVAPPVSKTSADVQEIAELIGL